MAAKFLASGPLRCGDTKRIMLPEICPKSFGTFEKQAPDLSFVLVYWHCPSGRRNQETLFFRLSGHRGPEKRARDLLDLPQTNKSHASSLSYFQFSVFLS